MHLRNERILYVFRATKIYFCRKEIFSAALVRLFSAIDKEHEPQRYQAVLDVNLMEMLLHVSGAESVEQLEQINLETAVTAYLIEAGMSQDDIVMLKQKLG